MEETPLATKVIICPAHERTTVKGSDILVRRRLQGYVVEKGALFRTGLKDNKTNKNTVRDILKQAGMQDEEIGEDVVIDNHDSKTEITLNMMKEVPEDPDEEGIPQWKGFDFGFDGIDFLVWDTNPTNRVKVTAKTEIICLTDGPSRFDIADNRAVVIKKKPRLAKKQEIANIDELRKISNYFLINIYEDDKEIIYFTDNYFFIKKKIRS